MSDQWLVMKTHLNLNGQHRTSVLIIRADCVAPNLHNRPLFRGSRAGAEAYVKAWKERQ